MTKRLHLLSMLALVVACVKPQPPERELPQAQSDLPRLGVYTDSPIESKSQYLDADFVLEDSRLSGKIRGRGNYTWELYPKKPYRIKLDHEESLLGLEASREWVLLADYRDLSLMRTAYMLELGKLAGVPFTSAYAYLDLYVNGEYQGVYILVEPVQPGGKGVDIDPDGFIVEEDTYWEEEPFWFRSGQGRHYTFKYPKSPDAEAKKFISGIINRIESGETAQLDLTSFAKWYLVNELIGNYDPNMFYVLPRRDGKLMMCPLWDAEGSLGVMGRNPEEPVPDPGSVPTGFSICTDLGYFRQLRTNPDFTAALEQEWVALKPLLPAFQEKMSAAASKLKNARAANHRRWQVNASYEKEVDYIEDYFARRVRWMDYYIDFLASEAEPVSVEAGSPDYSEPEAIDLGLSVLWASRNLGAGREYDSGSYFAWGETEPKDDYTWESYAYGSGALFGKYCYDSKWWSGDGIPDGLTELEPADDPVRVHLGGGWRLPTRWELWELWDFVSSNTGKLTFETEGGVKGFRIWAPSGASVFFPFAGRAIGKSIEDYGKYGYCWTSSLTRSETIGPAGAYFLGVEGATESVNEWTCGRFYGLPVRPVRER